MVQSSHQIHEVIVGSDVMLLKPVSQSIQIREIPVQIHPVGVGPAGNISTVILWSGVDFSKCDIHYALL